MSGRREVRCETMVDPDWVPTLATAPLALVLVAPMPDLCSEHGLPAVERRSCTVESHGHGSEMPTLRGFFQYVPLPWRQDDTSGVRARLRFENPACEFCLYEIKRYRRIAWAALLAIVLSLIVVGIVVVARVEWLYLPIAFVVVPGCMPVLPLVAAIAWAKSDYFADVWLTHSTNHLVVSAHPDFAANIAISED